MMATDWPIDGTTSGQRFDRQYTFEAGIATLIAWGGIGKSTL